MCFEIVTNVVFGSLRFVFHDVFGRGLPCTGIYGGSCFSKSSCFDDYADDEDDDEVKRLDAHEHVRASRLKLSTFESLCNGLACIFDAS